AHLLQRRTLPPGLLRPRPRQASRACEPVSHSPRVLEPGQWGRKSWGRRTAGRQRPEAAANADMAAIGASRPLALVAAKVSSPERQPSLGPGHASRAISSPVFVGDREAFSGRCNFFLFGSKLPKEARD